MASFSGMGTGLEEEPGCNRGTRSLPLANSSLTSLPPRKLRGRTSLKGQVGVGDMLPPREGATTHEVQRPSRVAAAMGIVLTHTPCQGRSCAAPASSRPKQLCAPAAEQNVENIKEENKIKQKEASPPHPTSPQSPPKLPWETPDTGHRQAGNILRPSRSPPGSLSLLVAEDPKPALAGEAEAADTGLHGAAVGPGLGDGVPDAAVRQPAGIAAIQPQELPGRVELPHPGDLGPHILAALLGLLQRHPSRVVQVENFS